MNKVKKILVKAKELSEDLYSVNFKDDKEFNAKESLVNKEVKEIRLEMLYVQGRIETLVHYLEGEYSCIKCGKWFTPQRNMSRHEEYFCPECEERYLKKIEIEKCICNITNVGGHNYGIKRAL